MGRKTKYDLLDFYEKNRFSREFKVYTYLEWWPVLDFMASYGHIFNNIMIVCLAINLNVNFFMAINLLCVCIYYLLASYRLQKRAMKDFHESGLQSQTDLACAYMITKKFKKGAQYEFLQIRHNLWKF